MQPIHISQLTQLRSVHQLGQCGSQLKSGNWGVMNGWIKGKHKQSSIRQSKNSCIASVLWQISAVTDNVNNAHWSDQKSVEPIIRRNRSVVKNKTKPRCCVNGARAFARFPYVCLWRSGWVTVDHTFAKSFSLAGQTPRVANANLEMAQNVTTEAEILLTLCCLVLSNSTCKVM